ncbi:uncharacterized protein MELLADRAFT_90259 [Melampsora larici-populina 98AG31]|uniref:Uncharacterized protein n=1 Tax=Melampsora larici-populina (strain 98AG31 / pathotype 3-4-7) TaxID=747676 RepID=F4RWA5_MELLP|nr:uncharacterized protein MELLADRAFT_90259 [Melampsora larici-populina 98AG31]EGG03250.1 hypothetical protein MELLADRAFT_90259 [Melampsora larici-populina 98AG31]
MSAQNNGRSQPYTLSTPRGGINSSSVPTNSANRASARSIRGLGAGSNTSNGGSSEPMTPQPSGVSTDVILAAIASLTAKLEKEVLMMSDTLQQEINTMSNRLDEEIGNLSNKFNEDFGKVEEQLTITSNRIERVTNSVEELATTVTSDVGHNAGNVQRNAAGSTGPATPAVPWTYTYELKQRVYAFAYDLVHLPNIAGYTALEDPNGDLLATSLFNTIKQKINKIPGTWATEQLPPVVNGMQDVAATQRYTSLVKDAGKHAREKLHNLVLHNIKNPSGTVPDLKRLLHRNLSKQLFGQIARQCGKTAEGLDAQAYWLGTLSATRLRIAYLQRREALCIFQSLRAGGGGGNIWHRVDLQLHHLVVQGSLYSSAFYKLIYDQDRALFDGKGYFDNIIEPTKSFDLPLEEEITEEMERIEQAGGSIVLED